MSHVIEKNANPKNKDYNLMFIFAKETNNISINIFDQNKWKKVPLVMDANCIHYITQFKCDDKHNLMFLDSNGSTVKYSNIYPFLYYFHYKFGR